MNQKKEVIILAQHTTLPSEPGYNRFRYLSELLAEKEFKVTLITSTFNHYNKSFRDVENQSFKNNDFNIQFINELGYNKNVCFKRILSQWVFAYNLHKYLKKKSEIPGVFFVGLPPHEPVAIVGKYAKRHNVPVIIDVQDLWPEAMKTVFNIPIISDIIFYPMKLIAKNSYKIADYIVAVSNEYVERALVDNNKSKANESVYIGTFKSEFDKGMLENYDLVSKPSDEIWITYIGTLGVSYDIKTLISAHKAVQDLGYKNVRLKVLGRGPLEDEFKRHAAQISADVDFLGYKSYGEMAAYLKKSDIAVNPLVRNAAQSIINKVGDYFSAGLAVLNGSLCNEMKMLIDTYYCGLNYEPENVESLKKAMIELIESSSTRDEMGENSRRLAEEKFDRANTYQSLVRLIERSIIEK